MNSNTRLLMLVGACLLMNCNALSVESRRAVLTSIGGSCAGIMASSAYAETDVDNFLRSGMVSMPMGVSGTLSKDTYQNVILYCPMTHVCTNCFMKARQGKPSPKQEFY